jgi:hypothetical protein
LGIDESPRTERVGRHFRIKKVYFNYTEAKSVDLKMSFPSWAGPQRTDLYTMPAALPADGVGTWQPSNNSAAATISNAGRFGQRRPLKPFPLDLSRALMKRLCLSTCERHVLTNDGSCVIQGLGISLTISLSVECRRKQKVEIPRLVS